MNAAAFFTLCALGCFAAAGLIAYKLTLHGPTPDPGLPPAKPHNMIDPVKPLGFTMPPLRSLELSSSASEIARVGAKHGWVVEQEQRNIGLLILVRGDEQMNVYYTRMTVGTIVSHPKKGRTQMFRRNVSPSQLEMLMQKPRAHSSKTGLTGYRKKRA